MFIKAIVSFFPQQKRKLFGHDSYEGEKNLEYTQEKKDRLCFFAKLCFKVTSQSPNQTEKSGLRRSNVPAQKFTKCVLSRLSLQKKSIVGSVLGPPQSGWFGPVRVRYSLNKSSKLQSLQKKQRLQPALSVPIKIK